jgi:hypothetical protein
MRGEFRVDPRKIQNGGDLTNTVITRYDITETE